MSFKKKGFFLYQNKRIIQWIYFIHRIDRRMNICIFTKYMYFVGEKD